MMDFQQILKNEAQKAAFAAWLAERRLLIYEWLIAEPRNAARLTAFEFVAQIPDKPLPKDFTPEEQAEYAAFFSNPPIA